MSIAHPPNMYAAAIDWMTLRGRQTPRSIAFVPFIPKEEEGSTDPRPLPPPPPVVRIETHRSRLQFQYSDLLDNFDTPTFMKWIEEPVDGIHGHVILPLPRRQMKRWFRHHVFRYYLKDPDQSDDCVGIMVWDQITADYLHDVLGLPKVLVHVFLPELWTAFSWPEEKETPSWEKAERLADNTMKVIRVFCQKITEEEKKRIQQGYRGERRGRIPIFELYETLKKEEEEA